MTAPDPKILAEAIKRSEADMQLFRGIDDPEIKKLVEFCEVILVAAKAYGPMREALEQVIKVVEDGGSFDPISSPTMAKVRAALNPKDPSHE